MSYTLPYDLSAAEELTAQKLAHLELETERHFDELRKAKPEVVKSIANECNLEYGVSDGRQWEPRTEDQKRAFTQAVTEMANKPITTLKERYKVANAYFVLLTLVLDWEVGGLTEFRRNAIHHRQRELVAQQIPSLAIPAVTPQDFLEDREALADEKFIVFATGEHWHVVGYTFRGQKGYTYSLYRESGKRLYDCDEKELVDLLASSIADEDSEL